MVENLWEFACYFVLMRLAEEACKRLFCFATRAGPSGARSALISRLLVSTQQSTPRNSLSLPPLAQKQTTNDEAPAGPQHNDTLLQSEQPRPEIAPPPAIAAAQETALPLTEREKVFHLQFGDQVLCMTGSQVHELAYVDQIRLLCIGLIDKTICSAMPLIDAFAGGNPTRNRAGGQPLVVQRTC